MTGTGLQTLDDAVTLLDLPCGCQDVYYPDGSVDYEHDHVWCKGDMRICPRCMGAGHLPGGLRCPRCLGEGIIGK